MTDNGSAEHQIGERMKELQALHGLSELTEREGITLDELYQELTNILPKSWQYPEIAYARIVIGDREFCTENFAISPWRQSAPVKVHGSVVGGVDVGYLKEKPEQDEGPFLKEERLLLNAIAERLGHITEHKQAEEALRESKELAVTKQSEDAAREYAESIVDTVREPLIILDADLRVVSASRSFYQIFRVVPEETVGQLIYDLGNKQWDIPKLRELLEKILPEKATFDNYEVEHDFTTIGRRIMLLNARQIQRVLGKERIILLAIEDITERKEIEAGLETARKELAVTKISEDAAREYAESVINTVREPLIALDQDLRVVSVSRSFYEFFKVNPEETVGQLIYDLGNKQWDIPKLRELLETILPEKTTFDNYEVEHDFTPIGRRIMLLNARQIQRALGKERIILLAIEDITERKEIEAGLETARKELAVTKISEDAAREYAESVINTVREPLIALDQDLRVVSVSRSFYEFFKVNPEETVGQLIYDLGNKQWDIPKLRELLEKILPEKATFDNYEVEHDFTTIGRRIMLLNARQIQRVLGKERIILLAIEDITERKQAEEIIRKLNTELAQRAAELEDAVKELEAFSYSVSHDLQAPLRAIDGFSRLLLTTTAGHLDSEQERLLQVIRSSTQQMGQLIADLLAFARLGRQELRKSKVNMEQLAQAVFAELRAANPDRPLELVMDSIPPALGDPSMLRRVWFNLLSNAVKFTRGRNPARIKIGSQTEGSMNRYSVNDNGVGFDMHYADKLFGVFQRLHSTREFEGTGVGLAIVQRVIHRLGGKVQADGTVGEGATFAFTLPKGE